MAHSLLQQVLDRLVSAIPGSPDSLTLAEVLWLAPLMHEIPQQQTLNSLINGPAVALPLPSAPLEQPSPEQQLDPSKSAEPPIRSGSDKLSSVGAEPDPDSANAPLLPLEALPRETDVDAFRSLLPVWLEHFLQQVRLPYLLQQMLLSLCYLQIC